MARACWLSARSLAAVLANKYPPRERPRPMTNINPKDARLKAVGHRLESGFSTGIFKRLGKISVSKLQFGDG
uniref:Uncharacterized protein n=1 Tax=uncultured marine microorganism HF4000_APKG2J17 TaxID=455546 RepID=B3T6K1_9ZZZZ|nr:hypothetical protein ALOHA_HF4000APKG2J17ctg1g17 [uncultured marine microorganism HF4000_APKG2J17]